MKVVQSVQLFVTPWTIQGIQLYRLCNSPGQNPGVGSLSLLQQIFPTQGSNPGLLHCRQILYKLSHKGSPRILEWVAYPFSSGSSWPGNQTGVSCIAGGFFTSWAMRDARVLTGVSCLFYHDDYFRSGAFISRTFWWQCILLFSLQSTFTSFPSFDSHSNPVR